MLLKTEAKSPHAEQATIIQNKRKAFETLMLVKDGSPKPRSILNLNWKHQNVLVIYPGLVQRDSRVKLKNVKRFGSTIQVTLDFEWGLSPESYYPMLVITIPHESHVTQLRVLDPNKSHPKLRFGS